MQCAEGDATHAFDIFISLLNHTNAVLFWEQLFTDVCCLNWFTTTRYTFIALRTYNLCAPSGECTGTITELKKIAISTDA